MQFSHWKRKSNWRLLYQWMMENECFMVLEMVEMTLSLLRNSNDTTGQTSSGIPRTLAELVSTLTQVVNISMNNHGSENT